MNSKFLILLLCVSLISTLCISQNRNRVWCFGDSAGIDFNNINNPLPIVTSLRTRGSCVTMCDTAGQLLYYANTRATVSGLTTYVYNKLGQLMPNGTNILGSGWYRELVTVSDPDNDSLYYLFCVGVTGNFGLKYSIIDMNSNGGLGSVIQKNIQLMPDKQADCISAVKHGNGRDWWILGRKFITGNPTNEFWRCLVTPSGVSTPVDQNIGSLNKSDISEITFSPTGDTLLFTNGGDLIEYYSFNRCTGLLSNPVTIRPPATTYSEWTWDNEFSPNGRYIYTSTSKDTTQLFQYDLQSANPLATRVTLYQSTFPSYCGGALKRAPDGKIYFSISYENVVPSYPYPDSIYNMYNMNLSVINHPDSPGTACDFQPYSFYLGGKRTYWGLPNNPDYDMPRDSGSVCDTIQWMGIQSPPTPKGGEMNVTYISDWQKLFVNAQNIKGKNAVLKIYDLNGRVVFSSQRKTQPPYFTQDVDVSGLSSDMYVVSFVTEREVLNKKFVKN